MKRCSRCGKEKGLADFSKCSRYSDGYYSWCKSCFREVSEMHRQKRKKQSKVIPNEKQCTKCGIIKKSWEFNKNSSSSDGLYSRCKSCSRKQGREHYYTIARFKEKTPEQKAQKYASEKARRKRDPYLRTAEHHRKLAKKFKMDYEELEKWYTKQFLKQQAHCAICGRITEELCIDHNHTTNQLRGLLCKDCNYGIGCFKDNPEYLNQGAEYLASCVLC